MTIITKKKSGSRGILSAPNYRECCHGSGCTCRVQLADKQSLVRNNGAEVQSPDPHKIEGVPESNINRDGLKG